MTNIFDQIAEKYDRWFDSPEGRAIFRAELACLRLLRHEPADRWLEVGVGTGRFAAALGIAEGVDSSPPMLAFAARRGIQTCTGTAEVLPYPDESFDGVLLVTTLSFVQDPAKAIEECTRVLRPGGTLLAGIIPAESPWGREYARKASEGHHVYSHARFLSVQQLQEFATAAGLCLQESASTLFWPPGSPPPETPVIEAGEVAGAGFVALQFVAFQL
ncbi:MAG: methyltransferase domain-containing protein [Dehalococcoidia bacterium]|nr:methyltransferase domain-containing protein [Dehalococcoidia bacterium]